MPVFQESHLSIVLTTKRAMKAVKVMKETKETKVTKVTKGTKATKVTERRRLSWSWTKALVGKQQCTELDAFPAFAWKSKF